MIDLDAIRSNVETSSTGKRAMLAVKYIPALIAEVERLHGGIQKLIDNCQSCGGDGERSMVPGGMSKCMACLPLRDLIYPINDCCELTGEAWKREN